MIDITDKLNIIFGSEYYIDDAKINLKDESTFWNNKRTIQYNNISGFAQAIQETKIANIIIGARINKQI
jgi:hypothetical protein